MHGHMLAPVSAGDHTLPLVLQACLGVLRSGLIVQRVNVAAAMFPGVVATPLVIGTIAGSGGKLLVDAITVACGEKKGKPACPSVPAATATMLRSLCSRPRPP
jgi:hypothetical protein